VRLLDIVLEMQVIGPAQHHKLPRHRSPTEQLDQAGQWYHGVPTGGQIQRRNRTAPTEIERCRQDSR
jgi:hypothetical protein